MLLCKGVISIKSTGMGMSGTIHYQQAGHIYFTLEVAVKDNRVRVRAYDFHHEAQYSGGKINNLKPACGTMFMTIKTWNSIKNQTIDSIEDMFNEFQATLKGNKDDW
jgi:hypothetical protein